MAKKTGAMMNTNGGDDEDHARGWLWRGGEAEGGMSFAITLNRMHGEGIGGGAICIILSMRRG